MEGLYFAYGSNMYPRRMRARAPSARTLGPARLAGYRLLCNKLGRDGSGKANLVAVVESATWGVVYRVSPTDLLGLDRVEQGYGRVRMALELAVGSEIQAALYLAERITSDPVPFCWYRGLMVAGAERHALPESHLAVLRALPCRRPE